MHEGTTKTAAPTGPRIIERPRLTKILDESDARIILLVAPAGYGKTTLARQWLKDKPHVWYQATAASADPVALVLGLARVINADVTAIQAVFAANRRLTEVPEALVDFLEPSLSEIRDYLVIDDYQFIADSAASERCAGEVMSRLDARALVTGRTRPAWCAQRDVTYGIHSEVGAELLRMTEEETAAVLPIRSVAASELASRTGGWPALVGLAAAGPTVAAPRRGTPDHLFRFFADELLRDVSSDFAEWLSECAVAPSLLASEATPADRVQEAVRRGFVVEAPGAPTMHPLLRAFFKDRLRASPDWKMRTRALAERIARDGEPTDAFEVILEFGHVDVLDTFLRSNVPELLRRGLIETTRRWASQARSIGYTGPALELIRADTLERRGSFADAFTYARAVASRTTREDPLHVPALLAAGRAAYLTDDLAEAAAVYETASEIARDASARVEALSGALVAHSELEDTHVPDVLERLRAVEVAHDAAAALRVAIAEMHFAVMHGVIAEGLATAAAGESLVPVVGDPRVTSAFLSIYSLLLAYSGAFRAARPYAAAARSHAQDARLDFAAAHIDLRDAIACVGSGDYTDAARLIARSTAHARASCDLYLENVCATTRMKLLIAQGLPDEAVAVPPPSRDTAAAFHAEAIAVRGAAHAMMGDITTARELAAAATMMSKANLARAAAASTSAMIGDEPAIALSRLLTTTSETGNVEFAVTCIRAHPPLADQLGECECGYDLESTRRELLRLARRQAAEGGRRSPRGLSHREQEVLQLLGQGLSNKAIAKALFISDVTVKVHLRHVYEKLGVRTRTEAALLAHEVRSKTADDGA